MRRVILPGELGSMAFRSAGDFQQYSAELAALALLSSTAYGRALLELADADEGRAALGLGSAAAVDYAASAWTPVRNNFTEVLGGGSITNSGTYVRVGDLVWLHAAIACAGGATIAGAAGNSWLSGQPFSPAVPVGGTWVNASAETAGGFMSKRTADLWVVATGWAATTATFVFDCVFSV